MFEVPILFLIFNREDTTQRVFNTIRLQKPKHLYVAADGARKDKPGEAEKCQKVRDIIKQVDWDCELKTLFREENLGCKIAVSAAITWFFEQEEQGIILEDDCLPDPSFFPFCEELLDRYKDESRIGHINGTSYLSGIIKDGLCYDFCMNPHIWGWASWRRVWKEYDVNFSFWMKHKDSRSFLFLNKWEEIYFTSFISDVINNRRSINTWDVQYHFLLRLQNQLAIYPAINMIENIGVGDSDATHTSKKTKVPIAAAMPFPIKHPPYTLRNKNLENKTKHFSWKRLLRYYLKLY